ncbi:hypothetical protein CD351_02865 [Erythrobacter sp. KY5]|uniref:response regulator transcription factor n=1 Tax=Erythrobacter sp. KY5 TaxID=2011159 RepID=UPI000DBF2DD3|nr:helix-turn-helix transcriptional regulator [Erythrobacter sp. KY5]AWW73365.1 hypothetical protein CD351_02865 [Erythrobacter sp. KY5]
MSDCLKSLTEKEKETLRLMARGHDAKSAASELALSVHTINERLRNARRKLDVTSSREAARILLESETAALAGTPKNSAYEQIGDAPDTDTRDHSSNTKHRPNRAAWIGGAIVIILAIGLAFAAMSADHLTEDTPRTGFSQDGAANQACDDELSAWLSMLIGAAEVGPDGTVALRYPVGDPRFLNANSGRYWQISTREQADFASRSLWDKRLDADWENASKETRFFDTDELGEEQLRKVDRILRLAGSETDWLFMIAVKCSSSVTSEH